jgi:hypothetical protein
MITNHSRARAVCATPTSFAGASTTTVLLPNSTSAVESAVDTEPQLKGRLAGVPRQPARRTSARAMRGGILNKLVKIFSALETLFPTPDTFAATVSQ